VAALAELAQAGTIDAAAVAEAIAKYDLDPDAPLPTTV
jgi:pyruvate dehydrogenase complex dehydrogenase (E1) component